MAEKHAPGPWKAGEPAWFRGRTNPADGKRPIYDGDKRVIANVYGEANANLIAAAPDLLEALKDCLTRFVEAFPASAEYEPIKRGFAALAKAEGK